MLGGESVPAQVVMRWQADHPGVPVVNHYGPTETAVGCTDYPLPAGAEISAGSVPIGRLMWNTRVYVLDGGVCPVVPGGGG